MSYRISCRGLTSSDQTLLIRFDFYGSFCIVCKVLNTPQRKPFNSSWHLIPNKKNIWKLGEVGLQKLFNVTEERNVEGATYKIPLLHVRQYLEMTFCFHCVTGLVRICLSLIRVSSKQSFFLSTELMLFQHGVEWHLHPVCLLGMLHLGVVINYRECCVKETR